MSMGHSGGEMKPESKIEHDEVPEVEINLISAKELETDRHFIQDLRRDGLDKTNDLTQSGTKGERRSEAKSIISSMLHAGSKVKALELKEHGKVRGFMAVEKTSSTTARVVALWTADSSRRQRAAERKLFAKAKEYYAAQGVHELTIETKSENIERVASDSNLEHFLAVDYRKDHEEDLREVESPPLVPEESETDEMVE